MDEVALAYNFKTAKGVLMKRITLKSCLWSFGAYLKDLTYIYIQEIESWVNSRSIQLNQIFFK